MGQRCEGWECHSKTECNQYKVAVVVRRLVVRIVIEMVAAMVELEMERLVEKVVLMKRMRSLVSTLPHWRVHDSCNHEK